MNRRNAEFRSPHQILGTPVPTRFGLRETKPKPKPSALPRKPQSIFKYGSPGRGVSGESSN